MEIVNEYIVIDVLRAQLKRSGYSFPLSVHKSLSEIVDFFFTLKGNIHGLHKNKYFSRTSFAHITPCCIWSYYGLMFPCDTESWRPMSEMCVGGIVSLN